MAEGYFGGTFDPIHVGHLDVAEAARAALSLDRVWLVPARVPPHRAAPHASAAHRFAMVALAIRAFPHLAISDVEHDDDHPSYTSNTMDRLEKKGVDLSRAFFITGADAFRDIAAWKDYPALLDRTHFVVVSRPGVAAGEIPAALSALAGRFHQTPCSVPSRPSIFLVDAPTSPVSSTEVRRVAAAGGALSDLVGTDVAKYIERQGLYRRV